MKMDISELSSKNYILEDKLTHTELHPFLNEKLHLSKKWFFYIYLTMLIGLLGMISFTITKNLIAKDLSIIQCVYGVILGIIISLLFIPIHEFIHYLAYKMCGAKSVSFIANFKKFYFVTIADKFVTNLKEFTWIAILPFATVVVGTLLSFPFLAVQYQLIAIVFVFTHTIFCGGDFALLNYMASNKGMVSYDDKEKGETYFYKKQSS
jgi:hypothetical protein